MLPVQLSGTRQLQHTFSSKVSLRRCRKVQWGAVLGLSLLFFGLMSVASVLPGRMAQAHHCSKLTDNSWLSRTLQAAGQQSSSSLPATADVSQAVVQAFTAVHAAAEQGLQPADMVWRCRSQPEPAGEVYDPCWECGTKQAGKHKQQAADSSMPTQPSSTAEDGPPVATVVARLDLSAILAGVGEYPQGSSSGRGIVVVGGGPKFTPAALVCVAFVRRTGCTLPIEVWAPPHEPIPTAVEADFTALRNVTLRSLGDAFPSIANDNMRERNFLSKQLAMLASAFQEVLFLDADNLPLRDPSFLFEEPLYTDTGLLMWPDFWASQVKAGAWEALGIPPDMRPKGSHESGQVVLDKQRAWQPLLLAIFLNMRGDVFYPLLSDIGQGDKETLPLAWLGLRRGKDGLVPHGTGALHTADGIDKGTAMLQRSPDGVPLFLHAHLPKIDVPKKHVELPPAVPRRWKAFTGADAVLPGGLNASRFDLHSYEVLDAIAGVAVEVELLQLRNYLRCRPEWVACCMQLQ